MANTTAEVCGNCGQAIGALETPRVWNDHVVCAACHAKLVPPALDYARPAAAAATPPPAPGRVQTVEQTGKRWKVQMLAAIGLFCVGMVVVCAGIGSARPGSSSNAMAGIGSFMVVGGLGWYVFARVMAWWHHG